MVKNGTRVYSNEVVKQRWTCKGCHHSQLANITPINLNHDPRYSCVSLQGIAKTWVSNGCIQMVIPKQLAEKMGLKASHVIIEETNGGLLIKKLEVSAN